MSQVLLRCLAGLAIVAAGLAPAPAAADLPQPARPGERAACPVCGMLVAPHPSWIAQVIFADGSALFFDGAKDLFRYLLAREEYAADQRGLEVSAVFVTSYYDQEAISAESAYYVLGSDVHGPMGPELVPHASRDEAEEFLRDHGGREIVRYPQVTRELLRTLRPGHGGSRKGGER